MLSNNEYYSDNTFSEISSTSNQVSIFSNDDVGYDDRIREIEEYYVRTLLLDNKELETNTVGDSTWPSHVIEKSYLMDSHMPKWISGVSNSGQSSLEVKINSKYEPANGAVRFTAENLRPMETPPGLFPEVLNTADQLNQQQLSCEKLNNALYKTELCESFSTTGCCRYNLKCQFAHGLCELKFKERSEKFRTKPCLNWAKTGYCKYGSRCCFKHDNDDDIKVYLDARLVKSKENLADEVEAKCNLHGNFKILQTMSW